MSFFLYGPRRIRLALGLALSLIVGMLSACLFSFESYADEGRSPARETVSSKSIKHTHTGSSEASGGCYTKGIYHQHKGNWRDGGECYATPWYHKHVSACDKNCIVTVESYEALDNIKLHCNENNHDGWFSYYRITVRHTDACGKGLETGDFVGDCQSCHYKSGLYNAELDATSKFSHTYKGCGLEEGELEYWLLSCDKSSAAPERYEADCGLEEKEYGSISIENTTPEWTNGTVTLKGALTGDTAAICGGDAVLEFYEADEKLDSDGDTVTVNHNGSYKLKVNIDEEHFGADASFVTLDVNNIDNKAPRVEISCVDAGRWTRDKDVIVTAEDVQDDGSPGSGLAEAPYSFDNGASWSSDNSLRVSEAGTVDIWVKDYCGNIFKTQTVVDSIDHISPTASYAAEPAEWYEGEGDRVFTINAADIGSGLAGAPYSYDGGLTWTDVNTVSRSEAGTFSVIVRDICGNETILNITNNYTPKPDSPNPGDGGGDGKDQSTDPGEGGGDSGNKTPDPDSGSDKDGKDSDDTKEGGQASDKESDTEKNADKDVNKDETKDAKKNSAAGKGSGKDKGSGGSRESDKDQSETKDTEAGDNQVTTAGIVSDTLLSTVTALPLSEDKSMLIVATEDEELKKTAKNPLKRTKTSKTPSGGGLTYIAEEEGEISGEEYPSLWNWHETDGGGYSIATGEGEADSSTPDYTGMTSIPEAESDSVAIPYASSDPDEIVMDEKNETDVVEEKTVPFYRTKAFKVTASVGGGAFGVALPAGVFLLMYSGVFVFSYDSNRYRFLGIRMIHRSERGRYIKMNRDFLDGSYSSRFKLGLGRIYTHMHKDELLHICAGDEWLSVPVQKHSYITLRGQ